ncbi:hypothetical protein E2C01_016667 [Portunus trituberculatus]|uniref:Uncharacterized protein n=1 Tax=Portunus trituberculatus TaxID=210409 RepID=A0A5B7DQ29_PORTR|nr:hypothetical protein [Portunus trituberculatus]
MVCPETKDSTLKSTNFKKSTLSLPRASMSELKITFCPRVKGNNSHKKQQCLSPGRLVLCLAVQQQQRQNTELTTVPGSQQPSPGPGKLPARRETEVLGSGPPKVMTNHFIKLFIEGNKKLTQLRHDCGVHIGMGTTLGIR